MKDLTTTIVLQAAKDATQVVFFHTCKIGMFLFANAMCDRRRPRDFIDIVATEKGLLLAHNVLK